jgi:1-pyrroline-2-carboxylate reductase [NAD(P)H]
MKIIDQERVHDSLNFAVLIPLLKASFAKPFHMPQRQVHALTPDDSYNHDAFALLPSWNDEVIGNKMFTYFPNNKADHGLPGLFSKIMLFSRKTGEPLALVDGTSVTYWRTAAISALASQLLSRPDSQHLMLFGTGNLAAYLLHAHISVRDLKKVTIWGRNAKKIQVLINEFNVLYPYISFYMSLDLEQEIPYVDIICCATAAKKPLFNGNWVSKGCHVDCLGNHMTDARECDSDLVAKASVYVDSLVNTLNEAGELLIPIEEGVFKANDIEAELAEMCKQPEVLRKSANEITLFKSVGTAISDLVTAYLVYQQTS